MLLERGHKVHVVDSLLFGQASVLMPYFFYDNFSFTKGDIRDEALMKKLVDNADIIIHLAAIVGEPAARVDPHTATMVNFETSKLLNKLRGDKPLVYASSGSNYGKVDGVCTEETPAVPLSHYAKTKHDAELELMSRPNTVAFRFATGFGVSPRLRLDLLVNDFVYKAITAGNLIVYQKNVQRTFIHVRDMARAFVFAVENFDKLKNEVYNVGHEKLNHTKEDLVNAVKAAVPKLYVHYAEVGYDPDQRDYKVSYAKIRNKGFEAQYTLEQGIAELVRALPSVRIHNPYTNFSA